MFISKEEADRRIKGSEKLLGRSSPKDSFNLEEILKETQEPVGIDLEDIIKGEKQESGPIGRVINNLDDLLSGRINLRRKPHLTLDEQAGVGVTARLLSATASARMNDLSASHANDLEHSYPSGQARFERKKKQALTDKILERTDIVVDVCFERLLKTMDLMTDEKLEEVQKAESLSRIARNIHGIISNATPREEKEVERPVSQFIIYKPEIRKEASYQTLVLKNE